jgi:hypothetical protein
MSVMSKMHVSYDTKVQLFSERDKCQMSGAHLTLERHVTMLKGLFSETKMGKKK